MVLRVGRGKGVEKSANRPVLPEQSEGDMNRGNGKYLLIQGAQRRSCKDRRGL